MATKKQLEPVAPAADKKKALEAALGQIEKQFGKGSVMRLGENAGMNVEHIPTGSIGLDLALGIGGLPRGRIVEIYGPESSGKTTVALHCVAEAQKMGGTAAFIDAEHALDPVYAQALGVDIDSLLVSQPDTGEQGLDIAEALVRSGAIDIVVIDSVAALTPRAEIEGEMGDSFVGLHARMMSQAMRKLAGSIAKSNLSLIHICWQRRTDPAVHDLLCNRFQPGILCRPHRSGAARAVGAGGLLCAHRRGIGAELAGTRRRDAQEPLYAGQAGLE